MRKQLLAVLILVGLPFAALAATGTPECPSGFTKEQVMIPSDTAGIELYLRHSRLACPPAGTEKRVLLYVHGATYPSETAFDLQLDGLSWMDFIALHGWDVWLVDLRGYGRSTRPAQMDKPAADNAPIVTTDVAVSDVSAAVEYVSKRMGVNRVTLLGWSWGTTIMGAYAAKNPDKVDKLVLYAPVWLRTTPSQLAGSGPLGAYRMVTKDAAKTRWLNGVPEDKKADLIPRGWFEAWSNATWATDPKSSESGMLRAPNGVLEDLRNYWLAEKPYYDPSKITAPTFLVVAEWDQDTPPYMAQALFGKLTAAKSKRLVLIGEGTHTIVMEKNRAQLMREVQAFLDE